jgi:hypothetical protein
MAGEDAWWGDWWWFEFTRPDESLAVQVRIGVLPNQGVVQYWATATGVGRLPVVVLDDEVPVPRRAGSLEIRTEGLWADHIVEVPYEQVTVGCEAFGLRLESVTDLENQPVLGERVPFGLDMEWETVAGAAPAVEPGSDDTAGSYEIPCEAHGLVLVADEEIQLESPGLRRHGWGVQPGLHVARF